MHLPGPEFIGCRQGNTAILLPAEGFPSDLVKRTRAMLSAMDAAMVLEDLRLPPGNHLEVLKGGRAGQHSVRINDQWRICFVWTEQGPADVGLSTTLF